MKVRGYNLDIRNRYRRERQREIPLRISSPPQAVQIQLATCSLLRPACSGNRPGFLEPIPQRLGCHSTFWTMATLPIITLNTAQVSHYPQSGQRPALLGFLRHSVVNDHATNRCAAGIGSGYGEQPHAIILQWQPIENQRVVRGQQNLARLVRVQVPLAQPLEE